MAAKLSRTRDNYALVPRSLVTDGNLTGEELRLLVFLMTYDLPDKRMRDAKTRPMRNNFVYVARSLMAAELKKTVRWVAVLIIQLGVQKIHQAGIPPRQNHPDSFHAEPYPMTRMMSNFDYSNSSPRTSRKWLCSK